MDAIIDPSFILPSSFAVLFPRLILIRYIYFLEKSRVYKQRERSKQFNINPPRLPPRKPRGSARTCFKPNLIAIQ